MVGIDDETGDGGEAKDSRRVNVLAVTGDLLVDVGRALRSGSTISDGRMSGLSA